MSYDTTVHDALDPPQPRIADASQSHYGRGNVRRYLPTAWRSFLATMATISLFAAVTWVVASFTTTSMTEQPQPAQHSDEDEVLRATATE